MAAALPYLTLGLGVYSTLQAQQAQKQAIAAAKEPRLSLEAQRNLRESGTSNIGAALAQRGLLDSSLYPGALAALEKNIGEAAAAAGPMGNVPEMLWQLALGMGQSGASSIGNLAQLYMMQKLFGGSATPTSPWTYVPPYSVTHPGPFSGGSQQTVPVGP